MPAARWTFMVYMAGDNNLSTAGDADLDEMRSVGSSPEVNVVVEFDNAGALGTRRFRVERNGVGERPSNLGETDSGSPESLLGFVRWAAAKYPAKHYALVLWNHGSGWAPSEIDRIAVEVRSPGYNAREASERSATPLGRLLFRTSWMRLLELATPAERAICSDDGSGHSLDTVELGRVLEEIVTVLGRPVDLLGMDACLMSNIEVAYEARSHARLMVASEENEPAEGWPYDRLLARLTGDPEISPRDLAAGIVADYGDSYRARGHAGDVTQAALDLSRLDHVVEPLDALAAALTAGFPAAADEVWRAQRRSARFWHGTLWDVAHFCQNLAAATRNDAVRQAAAAVGQALAPGEKRAVIAESHRGASVERCGGVSIYLPPLTEVSRYYPEVAYARDHAWRGMLEAYHQALSA